ncbi:MAG: cell wall anchor protein, partial [Muribaculaceae bacterium]|nr:cell wall anchor protein [Muribaculaceae bacterium]
IKTVFKAPAKPIPPYEMAMRQLEILRHRKLCERGQDKEYYTELTDILRVYLDRRFGINAMEMTTTQIKKAIRDNEATRPSTEQMSRILDMADFVKFAKVRPFADDNTRAINSALQFVQDTKPQPEPEPESTEVKPENSAKK